jgi:hypothetical protein
VLPIVYFRYRYETVEASWASVVTLVERFFSAMMVSTTFFDEAKTLQAVVGEPRAAGRYATASAAMVRAPRIMVDGLRG